MFGRCVLEPLRVPRPRGACDRHVARRFTTVIILAMPDVPTSSLISLGEHFENFSLSGLEHSEWFFSLGRILAGAPVEVTRRLSQKALDRQHPAYATVLD